MSMILVDQDLCTRCGICSNICVMGVIEPAGENTLPKVREGMAGNCIGCGHCEAYCPSQALILSDNSAERSHLPAGTGTLSSAELETYLKSRRSVRHYTNVPVPRETILELLDIARYAASGGNGQPVEWIVLHDPEKVKRVATLTIGWLKTLSGTNHPMSGYIPVLLGAWDSGKDVICRGAPHLLVATIPEGNPIAVTDGIIALTHFDVAAPAYGVGTCWAGFVTMAAWSYEPLRKELGIPAGRKCSYAMMFGHPRYTIHGIPRRKPLQVTWK